MTHATYADILRPDTRRNARLYDVSLIVGGSLAVGLSAQVALPLAFSPVPITGQTLAVLLVGALMGRVRGGVVMLLYLAEGVAGLPVFAGGGAGAAHLLGPTGGYLVGFVVAATVTGYLAERGWDRRFGTTLAAMLLGTVAIFVVGLAWLGLFTGTENLLAMGLYPFVPGAIAKIIVAAALVPQGWKLLDLRKSPGLND
ncbi:MAG: biotin transporter BioY [Candidatus Marinimicrobia bacterium]|nr:biotin transporter BioY [Candidatus Neomarinimicrobiota bacterium]